MSGNILSRGLTRRQFLKTTAATAAVVAVGDKLFGGPVSTLVESAAAAAAPVTEDVWIPSVCDACDAGCGTMVHRVNGVIVRVKGGHPDDKNAGKICSRSQALPMHLYNPWRVKTPMKRTNPNKGADVDPKWVEISWDEALDTVAGKLRAIRETDPRKFVVVHGHRGNDASYGKTWGRVFGTPTYNNSSFGGQTCSGCALHTFGAWLNGQFTCAQDRRYNKFWLAQGRGAPLSNKGCPEDVRGVFRSKALGAKYVSINPLLPPDSRNVADEWIPIRPGTDIAMRLALIYTIIHELGVYDVEFLKKRTNGPYLIGPDGLYVRASAPLIEDPARVKQKLGKPFIWDPVDGKAKMWDDPTIKDFALEGKYTVNGVECQPGFQLLKDHVKQFTPEWSERITTVPAETIRRLAKEWVERAQIGNTIVVDGVEMPYRPVGTDIAGRGVSVSAFAYDVSMAGGILCTLVGAINVPGGLLGSDPPNMSPDPVDGILQPGVGYYTAVYRAIKYPPQRADVQDHAHPIAYKTHYLLWPAIVNPREYGLEYEVEAMYIHGANPLSGGTGLETQRKAFAKVPFIFAISYHFDEPTEWADIVLPESSQLERHARARASYSGWSPTGKMVSFQGLKQPVIGKPVFNTREGDDILIDLCERVGILYGEKGLNATINTGLKEGYKLDLNTKYKRAEILDREYKGLYGDERGLEWFKKNVLIKPYKVEDRYGTPKWPTTRVPIYYEYPLWCGKKLEEELQKYNVTKVPPYESIQAVLYEYHPLPLYREQPDADAPPEYDLWACNYKTMLSSMAMTMVDNAWVYEVSSKMDQYDMFVWMNADTAARKGLKDGDLVWVESRYGKTQGEVKTSQCVHPEAVGTGGCFGLHSANAPAAIHEGASWNALLPLDEKGGRFLQKQLGGCHHHVKIKVYKA